ncbi:cache domain-containing protein [Candidatus Riflebacteria bacterium]
MEISLRSKLIVSFLVVIVVTGIVATFVGIALISEGVMREIEAKVKEDLNAAREIYNQKLREVEDAVFYTALRKFAIKNALIANDRDTLFQALKLSAEKAKLDVLTITDRAGNVVLRVRNPEIFGDSQKDDEIVSKVLRDRKPISSTQIVPGEELAKEADKLAKRAHIRFVPTPKAKPATQTEKTSGMMLQAAAPILNDRSELAGVLYGGCLINRSYEIVDKIKDTVYQAVKYKGKDIGTATIFQGDLRVSTNVKKRDGSRAIGTRVSEEVNNRVLGEGKRWAGRAFVVNEWYVTGYEPIRNVDGKVIGILYVGVLEEKYVDMKKKTTWTFVGITLLGIILVFVISCLLADRISRPVNLLNKGVEAIAAGDFDFVVNIRSRDEIGTLGRSFNRVRKHLKELYRKLQGKVDAADKDLKRVNEELRLANKELIERQEQLIRSEKLASLGKLAAGVAHEINNPLTGILTFSHLLLEDTGKDDPKREDLEVIIKETERCRDIVKGLLDYSRQNEPQKVSVDINDIIEKTLSLLEHQASFRNIEITREFDNDLPRIMIDKDKIQQVLVNILTNAQEAMPEGGSITITTTRTDGKYIEMKFADTGCGIAKNELQKLFDPFYSTKELGTGLGLSITQGIITGHRGRIEIQSEVGKGMIFVIRLPITESSGEES